MTKAEEIFARNFVGKYDALVRLRAILSVNEALEWAAQQADNLECGDKTPRCTIARRIRAGISGGE